MPGRDSADCEVGVRSWSSYLFAAFAISDGKFKRWLRWLLAGGAILSLLHAVGVILSSPVLIFLGFPAWGLLLPATTALLAIRFRIS